MKSAQSKLKWGGGAMGEDDGLNGGEGHGPP